MLGERRLRTLRELGTRTADAKSAEEVCREAAAALAMDPADVPFSLLYLIDGRGAARSSPASPASSSTISSSGTTS